MNCGRMCRAKGIRRKCPSSGGVYVRDYDAEASLPKNMKMDTGILYRTSKGGERGMTREEQLQAKP